MGKKEVTIITAFFDVGRKDFKGGLARNNEKYLTYFKFWARLKNNLIVYTDSETAEQVLSIREEFGLKDKTKTIIVEDFNLIEPEILDRMLEISESETFLKYRYMPNPADNNARYDYIMLLKSWCMQDAVKRGHAEGMLVWIDFGFNHGGDVYTNPLEFDFKLEMDLPNDKITLFSIMEDDNKPIFQIVQSYAVYIMGFMMCVPSHLAEVLWSDIKRAMTSLLDVGFIDDDQTLLLMAARNNREKYNLVASDWFMPLKENGGEHLTINTEKRKPILKDRLLHGYRVNKRRRNCKKNLKSIFLNND